MTKTAGIGSENLQIGYKDKDGNPVWESYYDAVAIGKIKSLSIYNYNLGIQLLSKQKLNSSLQISYNAGCIIIERVIEYISMEDKSTLKSDLLQRIYWYLDTKASSMQNTIQIIGKVSLYEYQAGHMIFSVLATLYQSTQGLGTEDRKVIYGFYLQDILSGKDTAPVLFTTTPSTSNAYASITDSDLQLDQYYYIYSDPSHPDAEDPTGNTIIDTHIK